MLKRLRESRAEARRQANERERQALEAKARQERDDALKRYRQFQWLCENWKDAYDESSADIPIRCKKGEHIIAMSSSKGWGLVEAVPKRVTVGASKGASFRVAKGLTVRTGGSKGRVVHLPDELKLVVSGGTVVVTNARVVFVGATTTREFRLDKLTAISHAAYGSNPAVMLPVENRQRTSGVVCSSTDLFEMLLVRIQVAQAVFDDEADILSASIQREIDELEEGIPYSGEHGDWDDGMDS